MGFINAVPGGPGVALVIDAANKLMPGEKRGDEKLEAVLRALRVKHPDLDRDTALFSIEQIVAAINTVERPKTAG